MRCGALEGIRREGEGQGRGMMGRQAAKGRGLAREKPPPTMSSPSRDFRGPHVCARLRHPFSQNLQLPCHNWNMLVIWRKSGLAEVASETVSGKCINPAKGGVCATAHGAVRVQPCAPRVVARRARPFRIQKHDAKVWGRGVRWLGRTAPEGALCIPGAWPGARHGRQPRPSCFGPIAT